MKFKIFIALYFVCLVTCLKSIDTDSGATIIINEFMIRNDTISGIADEDGKYSDWVEIYNICENPIFLGNFYISDNIDQPLKSSLPRIYLEPSHFLLLWGGESETSPSNHIGFNFSVSNKKREKIILFNKSFEIIDSISYLQYDEATKRGVSFGRVPDGSIMWRKQKYPSPGQPNKG